MAKHTKPPPVFDVEDDAVIVLPNAKDFDPQAAGEAITKIAEKHGGKVRPVDLVEAARDPHHACHKHFEWDDSKAAHQHRLDQARIIIRIVRIETGDPVQLRKAFISLPQTEGRSYRTLADVINSGDLRERILEMAESELAAWKNRYRDLVEIVSLVDPALAALKQKRRKPMGGSAHASV